MLSDNIPTITIAADDRASPLLAAWAAELMRAWIYVMRHEHMVDREFAEVVDLGGEA